MQEVSGAADKNLHRPNSCGPYRLYSLCPLGVGGELCEALTSYISRLAYAHGVLTSSLVSQEIAPVASEAWAARTEGKGPDNFFRRAASLCSTGTSAANLVDALQRLAGRADLGSATMLRWADVLPTRGLVRQYRAWCPCCYAHWRSTGHTVYDPLLWCLEAVSVCHIHKTPLASSCANCGSRIRHLSPAYRPGYCSECHAWLAEHCSENLACDEEPVRSSELARSSQVATLLNAAPGDAPGRGQVKENLVHIIGLATGGNIAEFARGVGVPKNTLWLWCNGTVLPQLETLAAICSSVGVQLSKFLDPTRPELSPCWPPRFTSPRRSNKRPARHFQTDTVRSALQRVIDEPAVPPPSMLTVSQQLDFDVRLLRKHFPALCRAISDRHQNHIVLSGNRRVQSVVDSVTTATLSLHAAGIYPSHRRVESLLPTPGVFIEPCARNAWRDTVSQLDETKIRCAKWRI